MNPTRAMLLALVLLLAVPASAQDAPPQDVPLQAPPLQMYRVELILFNQLDAVAADAWPSSNRTRVPRSARALLPLDGDEAPPENFQRLASHELGLRNMLQRLQQTGEFEPLLHLGWKQSHGLLRNGRRVRLDEEIDGLSGYLALRLGNRLVAEIDITLDAPEKPPEPEPRPNLEQDPPTSWSLVETSAPMTFVADPDSDESAPPQGYRLHQQRTIRLGENHYFDHPAFGVMLRVERILPDAAP